MNYPLSDVEVERLTGNKYKVVPYPDLIKYKTINELLGPFGGVVLLYETRPNYGHYTALFRRDFKTLEQFDSLGFKLDHELKKIDKKFRIESNQRALLSKLILNSSYEKYIYNENKLQKNKDGINTCGRFVALRLLFRDLSHKQFINLFKNIKNKDEYVVYLTENLF